MKRSEVGGSILFVGCSCFESVSCHCFSLLLLVRNIVQTTTQQIVIFENEHENMGWKRHDPAGHDAERYSPGFG